MVMLITLIWKSHRVYMNWHVTLYTLNTYNYVPIKKVSGHIQLAIILHGKKSGGGMAPGRITSMMSSRTEGPSVFTVPSLSGVSFPSASRWSQHFQTPNKSPCFAGSAGEIKFSPSTSISGKRMATPNGLALPGLHSILGRGHFLRRVGTCTH